MKLNSSKSFLTLTACTLAFGLSNCGKMGASDSDAEAGTISEQLAGAATYVDSAMPDIGSTVGSTSSVLSIMDGISDCSGTDTISTARWSDDGTTCSGDFHYPPPGGYVTSASDEPQYDGANLPTTVNFRDYFKMMMDSDFRRYTSDNGGSTYTPGLYGRMQGPTEILGYLSSAGFTLDTDGTPSVGTQTGSLNVDGNDIALSVEVASTTDTTYYDKSIAVTGYADMNSNGAVDSGEPLVVNVLIFVRVSDSEVNFMQVDQSESEDNAGEWTTYIDILKWNTTTGVLAYEWLQDSGDTDDSGNANIEHYRVFVSGTDEDSWVYGLTGKTDSTDANNEFEHFAIHSASSSTTEGTYSVHKDFGGTGNDLDVALGTVCVTFSTGAANGGGRCSGQVTTALDIKAGGLNIGNTMRGATTYDELAGDKGFPVATHSTYTASDAARDAWISAGESISVSFSSRATFIDDWDGTP